MVKVNITDENDIVTRREDKSNANEEPIVWTMTGNRRTNGIARI